MNNTQGPAAVAKLLRAIAKTRDAKDKCHDIIYNEAADLIMRDIVSETSTSYPYLAVAQHHEVDYGEVLAYVEFLDGGNTASKMNTDIPWQLSAQSKYLSEMIRRQNAG